MKAEEIEYIETEVKVNLMPEIKKSIPTVLGWVLRVVFPKLELRIISFVIKIVEHLLNKKKLPNPKTMDSSSCLTPKPLPKLEPGYWECQNNEWVWIPIVLEG